MPPTAQKTESSTETDATAMTQLLAGASETQVISALARSSEGMAGGIRGSTEAASLEAPADALGYEAVQAAATWEDLEIKYDRSFIFTAYQTLLARKPDPEGLSHYLIQLRKGKSKIQILAELLQSAEYKTRATHLKQLHRALSVRENEETVDRNNAATTKDGGPSSPIETTTREVLAYSEDAFVTHVSLYSLGAASDLKVTAEYVARMKAGFSKAQMLTEFLNSKPAKRRAALLRRLRSEIRKRWLARIPIVGPLITMFFNIEGDSSIERRLRRIENRLFSIGAEFETHTDIFDRDSTEVISGTEREVAPLDLAPGLEPHTKAKYVPAATKRAAASLRSLPEPKKWVGEKDDV